MKWIDYDIDIYIKRLLGLFNKANLNWLISIMYPLKQLWRGSVNIIGWNDYRKRKYYESNISGQTLSLQEHLNKELDPIHREIRILHKKLNGLNLPLISEGYNTVKLSLRIENKGIGISLKGEDSLKIDTGFLVLMPSYVNQSKLKSIVNTYKLAGKKYKVEIH